MSKTDCVNIEKNEAECPCASVECERHGVCCECLSAHSGKNLMPSCLTLKLQESEGFRRYLTDLAAQADA